MHDHRRRVGGQSDMTYNSLFLQFKNVIKNSVLLVGFPVTVLILAMNKAVIDVIRMKLFKLPRNGFPDCIKIQRPPVFACRIIRAEMNLINHLVAHIFECFAIKRKCAGVPGCQIEIIDAVFKCMTQRSDCFIMIRFIDIG